MARKVYTAKGHVEEAIFNLDQAFGHLEIAGQDVSSGDFYRPNAKVILERLKKNLDRVDQIAENLINLRKKL